MKNKVKHFKVSASFFPNLHLFTLFQNENKKLARFFVQKNKLFMCGAMGHYFKKKSHKNR